MVMFYIITVLISPSWDTKVLNSEKTKDGVRRMLAYILLDIMGQDGVQLIQYLR